MLVAHACHFSICFRSSVGSPCLSDDPRGGHRPFVKAVGALWDCVPRICGGGSDCAGGGVPLGDVSVLSWCGEVSLGGKHSLSRRRLHDARRERAPLVLGRG